MSSKQKVYGLLHKSGMWRVFGRRARGAVFMLHRVVREHAADGFDPNRQFAITADVLRTILDALTQAGFDVVGLDEACARIEAPQRGARRFACLTFDDGYRDNYELALPIFAERGLPLATYVTTGLVDRVDSAWWFALEACLRAHDDVELRCAGETRRHAARDAGQKTRAFEDLATALQRAPREARLEALEELRERYGVDAMAITDELVMDWEMLGRFAREELVTIGAHTVSHAALSTLDDASMRAEIEGSRSRLEEQLGWRVQHFAYPYGDVTTTGAREFECCRALGFRSATTTRHGLVAARDARAMHQLPRIPTDPFETRETIAVKLSGIPALLQSMRRRRAS